MPAATLPFSPNASSRAEAFFSRSEGSRVERRDSAREIPIRRARWAPLLRAGSWPAGESAGLRDDSSSVKTVWDTGKRPLMLGHRGARAVKSIPENTVESFDRALADGCDGFEFDVRLTADGKAVICHDPKSESVEIARAQGEGLPHLARLEDIIGRYQDRAFLDIELKVGGIEKLAAELLHTFPPQRGFVVSSFLPEVLQRLRGESAGIPLGLICETQMQLRRWTEIQCEWIVPHYKLLDRALVQQLKAADKRVVVWTVNSAAGMRRFADWGVDGIVSDDAALLARTFRG